MGIYVCVCGTCSIGTQQALSKTSPCAFEAHWIAGDGDQTVVNCTLTIKKQFETIEMKLLLIMNVWRLVYGAIFLCIEFQILVV